MATAAASRVELEEQERGREGEGSRALVKGLFQWNNKSTEGRGAKERRSERRGEERGEGDGDYDPGLWRELREMQEKPLGKGGVAAEEGDEMDISDEEEGYGELESPEQPEHEAGGGERGEGEGIMNQDLQHHAEGGESGEGYGMHERLAGPEQPGIEPGRKEALVDEPGRCTPEGAQAREAETHNRGGAGKEKAPPSSPRLQTAASRVKLDKQERRGERRGEERGGRGTPHAVAPIPHVAELARPAERPKPTRVADAKGWEEARWSVRCPAAGPAFHVLVFPRVSSTAGVRSGASALNPEP